jgi:hypothetical protein
MEPIKRNLEPIEESDLDLEGKLKRGNSIASGLNNEKPLFSVEHEKLAEISSAEKDSSYGKILSKVQARKDADVDELEVSGDAKNGIEKIDAETQIQHLVDIAVQKGVVHAVKVARHMEDNYILDSFHDRLMSEELHDALIKKGLIGED